MLGGGHILLVEDDESFGYVLKEYLRMNDFEVYWLKDGSGVLKLIQTQSFDLVILDIMLPNKDGFTVAEEIKAYDPFQPFIFLTAKALKVDKLKGFKLGCDDYIVKPIDEELFLAKVQALLKRMKPTDNRQAKSYTIGSYTFDYENQSLHKNGHRQILTGREARLLKMLCDSEGQVLDRKKVLKELWGTVDIFSRKSMDVFIFKLRKYLEGDPAVRISNVHGKGFVLEIVPDP